MKPVLLLAAAWLAAVPAARALSPGDPAPPFSAPATDGTTVTLESLKGQWVALAFYPKAFTPGCTRQCISLRDGGEELTRRGVRVFGVSLDRRNELARFRSEYRLPFELLSDARKKMASDYGVLAAGGLYARRVSFLIGPDGRIAAVIDPVDVTRHDRQILEALDALGTPTPQDPPAG